MFEKASPQAVTLKRAAVWARVSTHDQAETSLPSQISRCKEKLESSGYAVTHTFAVDWSSLDLFSCPEFQQLLSLIKNKEIDALGVFDRDRLEAKGLQRLTFLSECKDAGVQLILCQGPPILDEPEGQLVELALAIGKERQVLRARQGSRDGLHDRVRLYHKPVTYRKLYGFDWDKANDKLLPNADYPNVKLIFDMLRAGSGYTPIIKELKRQGILSPSGLPEWNKQAVSQIMRNPVYYSRYYGLKSRSVEPSMRPKKSKRVNSSKQLLPLDEEHWLKNIEVVNPPAAWEERELFLAQAKQHMRVSQRHANNDYLLRGLILCGTHRGKLGEPRVYHGKPHHGSFAYVCPASTGADKCTRPFIRGSELDDVAKTLVKLLFVLDSDDIVARSAANRRSLEDIDRELREVDAKYQKKTLESTRAYRDLVAGKIDQDMYDIFNVGISVERNGILARQKELSAEKAEVGREKVAAESLRELADRYAVRVMSAEMSNAEWRDLFVALNLRTRVEPQATNGQYPNMRDVIFEIGLGTPLNVMSRTVKPPASVSFPIVSVSPAPD